MLRTDRQTDWLENPTHADLTDIVGVSNNDKVTKTGNRWAWETETQSESVDHAMHEDDRRWNTEKETVSTYRRILAGDTQCVPRRSGRRCRTVYRHTTCRRAGYQETRRLLVRRSTRDHWSTLVDCRSASLSQNSTTSSPQNYDRLLPPTTTDCLEREQYQKFRKPCVHYSIPVADFILRTVL